MYGRQSISEFNQGRALSPLQAFEKMVGYLLEKGNQNSEANEYDLARYRLLNLAGKPLSESESKKKPDNFDNESSNVRMKLLQEFLYQLLQKKILEASLKEEKEREKLKQEIITIENGLLLLNQSDTTLAKSNSSELCFMFTNGYELSREDIAIVDDAVSAVRKKPANFLHIMDWFNRFKPFQGHACELNQLVRLMASANMPQASLQQSAVIGKQKEGEEEEKKKSFTTRDIQRLQLYIEQNPSGETLLGAILGGAAFLYYIALLGVVMAGVAPGLAASLIMGSSIVGGAIGYWMLEKCKDDQKIKSLKPEIGPAPIFEKGHVRTSLAELIKEEPTPKTDTWCRFFARCSHPFRPFKQQSNVLSAIELRMMV